MRRRCQTLEMSSVVDQRLGSLVCRSDWFRVCDDHSRHGETVQSSRTILCPDYVQWISRNVDVA